MIHFDHAATSLPRRACALRAYAEACELPTPGRGNHAPQARAQFLVDSARAHVARLVSASKRTVCFVPGATAALSQAILGLTARPSLVLHDPLLHNAVRRPLRRLARQGTRLAVLPHDERGRVDAARAAREWPAGVEWVVVTHGSNVTGVVQPVEALVELAHARGARVIVDAAQTAGWQATLPVGDADVVAFSAHKALAALPGTGVLAMHEDVELVPLVTGGTGFDSRDEDMPREVPYRFEAGTPNLPGIAAAGAAAEELGASGEGRLEETTGALIESLRAADVRVLARGELPIALVEIAGLAPLELEEALDRVFGITTRAGTHCAPLAHDVLGTGERGALRISAGPSTTASDFAALTHALAALGREVRA